MSFFYLTPVKGDIPLHLLEIIITKRLEYHSDLLKGNTLDYNEFVVEGSLYDNVGHFMLCIIAILGKDTSFLQYFLNAEVKLFLLRIESQTAYDIRSFAKRLLRNIRKHDEVPNFIDALRILCQHLCLKELSQHVVSSTHSTDCKDFNIKTDFRNCLHFVAKRQVEIHKGIACIPCGKWKQYLTLTFRENLKYRLQKTNLSTLNRDPRVMELLSKIKRNNFSVDCKQKGLLLSKDVDKTSKFFPPCMLNLHLSLRKKHRLSHMQRFYYSLFLKDIGLPVTEAINFWQTEYSQRPNGTHSCCHNWVKDEKKYLYGIRHMYGLEGGKKNYPSVNCKKIQNSACSEGGCPFKSFDLNKTLSLLNNPSQILLSKINELQTKEKYTEACVMYLSAQNVVCDNFSFNFTPVKYYNACKNSM